MSAELFEKASDIKQSLTKKADLLAKRDSTQARIIASMGMFRDKDGDEINSEAKNDIASIIADYTVCPRP